MTSMVWMCEQHCVAATDFSLSGQQTILCVRLSSSNMLETFFCLFSMGKDHLSVFHFHFT